LTTEWSGTDVRGARVGPMASHPRYAGPALAGPLRPPQAA
jgi:hypothetical protein